jgi:MFS family permease
MTLDTRAARWRYLLLVGLRWLPVGFMIPISVLLPLDRGLSLSQIGLAFAAQGVLVLILELPTGGLSDSWGRRPVLLLASAFGILSLTLMVFAHSFVEFLVVWGLQGVFRALDSGPLEAWYVDATLAADPTAKLDRGLSAGSAVLSGAIAVGALSSGGLIALDPFDSIATLTLPVIVAVSLAVVSALAVVVLMTEQRAPHDRQGLLASARAVPRTVKAGAGLARSNRILLCLIGVELFWGFGMVTFESLMPVRLSEVLGSTDKAAALMGPVSSAAWFASAAGAALITFASRRLGIAPTAALTRVLQGLTVVIMGIVAGPVGLVIAYLACYTIHGASNPLHMTLLHDEVTAEHRSTMISLNSMVSQPAGSAGVVVLTALADGTSVSTALVTGGIVLAVAAPLYLPAWRKEKARRAMVVRPDEPEPVGAEDVVPLH